MMELFFSPQDEDGKGGSYIKPWYYQLPAHLHSEFSQNNDFPIHLQKEKEGLDTFRSYGLNAPNSRLLSITITGKLERVLLISNIGGVSLEKLGSSEEDLMLFEKGLKGFLKDMKEKIWQKDGKISTQLWQENIYSPTNPRKPAKQATIDSIARYLNNKDLENVSPIQQEFRNFLAKNIENFEKIVEDEFMYKSHGDESTGNILAMRDGNFEYGVIDPRDFGYYQLSAIANLFIGRFLIGANFLDIDEKNQNPDLEDLISQEDYKKLQIIIKCFEDIFSQMGIENKDAFRKYLCGNLTRMVNGNVLPKLQEKTKKYGDNLALLAKKAYQGEII